jgi:large subunit ribosomal protein L10
VFEGKAISAEDVRRLADLESREVLLAKLAGAMKGSLQQAVSMFAAPLAQMARALGALEAKGGAGPAAETEPEPVAAEATDVVTEAPAEADAADGETSTSEATEQE